MPKKSKNHFGLNLKFCPLLVLGLIACSAGSSGLNSGGGASLDSSVGANHANVPSQDAGIAAQDVHTGDFDHVFSDLDISPDTSTPGRIQVSGRLVDCFNKTVTDNFEGAVIRVSELGKRQFMDTHVEAGNLFSLSFDSSSQKPLEWELFLLPSTSKESFVDTPMACPQTSGSCWNYNPDWTRAMPLDDGKNTVCELERAKRAKEAVENSGKGGFGVFHGREVREGLENPPDSGTSSDSGGKNSLKKPASQLMVHPPF